MKEGNRKGGQNKPPKSERIDYQELIKLAEEQIELNKKQIEEWKEKMKPKLIHNAVYKFNYDNQDLVGIYKDDYNGKALVISKEARFPINDCAFIEFYAKPEIDDGK